MSVAALINGFKVSEPRHDCRGYAEYCSEPLYKMLKAVEGNRAGCWVFSRMPDAAGRLCGLIGGGIKMDKAEA